MSEFHVEAPQATANEGLAKDPNVAARAGFEPTTLRMKGAESTNEPPSPSVVFYQIQLYCIKYSCIVSNTVVLYQIQLYFIINGVVLHQLQLYCIVATTVCRNA